MTQACKHIPCRLSLFVSLLLLRCQFRMISGHVAHTRKIGSAYSHDSSVDIVSGIGAGHTGHRSSIPGEEQNVFFHPQHEQSSCGHSVSLLSCPVGSAESAKAPERQAYPCAEFSVAPKKGWSYTSTVHTHV
jgi:hypothetical protein